MVFINTKKMDVLSQKSGYPLTTRVPFFQSDIWDEIKIRTGLGDMKRFLLFTEKMLVFVRYVMA